MDTKDFKFFMECFETRSINKAAKSLYITPQGLGKILDRLEREARVLLFNRTSKGLEPTDAGNFFYEKTGKIIKDMNELEAGMERFRNSNRLRIGFSCGFLRIISNAEIEKFASKHPALDVIYEEGINSVIKDKLVNNQLDIAFIIGRMAGNDMIEKEIFSRQVCAVVHKTHPLFKQDTIKVAQLKGEQLITLNENFQLYTNLFMSCEKEHFFPNISIKTMEASRIYELVENNLGVGIDADIHEINKNLKNIRVIPVVDFIPWKGYMIYNKDKRNDEAVYDFIAKFTDRKS